MSIHLEGTAKDFRQGQCWRIRERYRAIPQIYCLLKASIPNVLPSELVTLNYEEVSCKWRLETIGELDSWQVQTCPHRPLAKPRYHMGQRERNARYDIQSNSNTHEYIIHPYPEWAVPMAYPTPGPHTEFWRRR